MSAFLITSVVPSPNEKEALAQYSQGSGPLLAQHGGQPKAKFKVVEQLHGDSPAALLSVAEFPGQDNIKGFFNSDAYQPLIPIRDKALSSVNIYISQSDQHFGALDSAGKTFLITAAMPNPHEQASLARYQQGAGQILGKYGAKPAGKLGIAEALHGDHPIAFLAVVEFPNADAVKAAFNDEAYQALIPLRDKALGSLNLYIAN